MSLDIHLTAMRPTEVHWDNITHNLGRMAKEAGIYYHLWRPEEIGITIARDLVEPLSYGLQILRARPDHFRQFDAENGWGRYENLVEFVQRYYAACMANPDAEISVSR